MNNITKIGIKVFSVALLISLLATASAAATTVSIADTVVGSGGVVTLPIMISNITNYGMGTMDIRYNSSVVHVTDVTGSSDSNVVAKGIDNTAGVTRILASNTGGVSGNIIFANAKFMAVGVPGSVTSLNIDVIELYDTSYNGIPANISDGSIRICDLDLYPCSIDFSPAWMSNATDITVTLFNNGTGDACNFTVNVTMMSDCATNWTNITNTSVCANAYKNITVTSPPLSHCCNYTVNVTIDPENKIIESNETNNTKTETFHAIRVKLKVTHNYGDDSTYNGPMSGNTDVDMIDVVKLAPEGTDPVELLKSVANSTTPGGSTPIASVDGLMQNDTMRYYWYPFVNGIPVPWSEWETYPLHEDDLIRWEFLKYVNSSFKARPVMDYPEPFLHGYNGTVHNIIVVYPDELCYPAKANNVETGLTTAGVSVTITKKKVEDVSSSDKQNNNLILLGTPSNNPIIADIDSQRLAVGLPVYFDGSHIIDDSNDTAYVGGVIEACDNPYDGADWNDTGPSVWLVAAADDCWAYKAADLLADDPDQLDRFWAILWLNVTLNPNGTVMLDWSHWPGTCGTSYKIYITDNLTAGFPATPNATTSSTSWTDMNAASHATRYYKVTCNPQVGGVACMINYNLKNGANWNTMPSMNPSITDARELIDDVANCPTVAWWNETSQSLESYSVIIPGVIYVGTNFTVKPASGYEIQVSSDTEWGVVGWVPPICPIDLKTGANWIGMPFNTTINDARELIDDVANCPTVAWWNETSQSPESYSVIIPGVIYVGTNFTVKPASGYEIQVDPDTTWTPR